jgi:hypothetical protein
MNDLTGLQSAKADVFVDAGVTDTIVVGRQTTVEDLGTGTVVLSTPRAAASSRNQNGR